MESNVLFSFDDNIEDSPVIEMSGSVPVQMQRNTNEDSVYDVFLKSPSLFLTHSHDVSSNASQLNVSCSQVSGGNKHTKTIKQGIQPKRSSAARRLIQGNENTAKLVSLGEKKLLMKKKIYLEKLKLMKEKNINIQDKNLVLQRIAFTLENKNHKSS